MRKTPAPIAAVALITALIASLAPQSVRAHDSERAHTHRASIDRPEAIEEGMVLDDQGRVFRAAFPLYDRAYVGGAWGVQGGEWSAGTGLRLSFSLDFPNESIWWRLRHEFGAVQVSEGGQWRATLLDGRYLRHDTSSYVTVPSFDVRLPAPFDIAVDAALLDVRGHDQRVDTWEIARVAFMADWIRDPLYRHRFATGFAASFGIERADGEEAWTQALMPLSGARVVYGWDHARGLVRTDAQGTCGLQALSSGAAPSTIWRGTCEARAIAAWTPLAISDLPVSIPLEGRALWREGEDASWQVTVGIQLGVTLGS